MASASMTPHLNPHAKDEAEIPPESLSIHSEVCISHLPMVSLPLMIRLEEWHLRTFDNAHPSGRALYESLFAMGKLAYFFLYDHRIILFFRKGVSPKEHADELLETLSVVYGARGFTIG